MLSKILDFTAQEPQSRHYNEKVAKMNGKSACKFSTDQSIKKKYIYILKPGNKCMFRSGYQVFIASKKHSYKIFSSTKRTIIIITNKPV